MRESYIKEEEDKQKNTVKKQRERGVENASKGQSVS